MRPSASLCQASRHRLLTLLLVSLLGILSVQTASGTRTPTPNFGLPGFLTKSQPIVGGTPLERNYQLVSRCGAHVQITPVRGRNAINAGGNASSVFAQLTFESHSPTDLKIVGVKTQKYMCFSKKGWLVARFNGNSKRCRFREQEKGGYIMLQSVAQPSWYVGFNKQGNSEEGFGVPKSSEAGSRTRKHGRQGAKKRRGRKRHQHGQLRRRGNRRRHRHGLSRRRGTLRRRGRRFRKRVRKNQDGSMCFQFIKRRTDTDRSDPRVQSSLTKQIHDPLKDWDVSKFISTPDPR